MRRNAFIAAFLALYMMGNFVYAAFVYAASSPQVEMVKKVMPAVVGIGIDKRAEVSYRFSGGADFRNEFKEFYKKDEQEFKKRGKPQKEAITPDDIEVIGSGFFVDNTGKVMTAYHVIQGQKTVYVLTRDNKIYKANVFNGSQEDDVAVLQIEGASGVFPFVSLGDSDKAEIAESVIAIGNPFGFTFTVTRGIVSSLNRTLGDDSVSDLIQTDASINPGNSGGPLLNMDGEVIGINHAIISPAPKEEKAFVGLGFAIPINKAKPYLVSAAAPPRGVYLGISLDTDERGRIIVDGVDEGSPAAEAGLIQGDMILSIDGRGFESAEDLSRYIKGKRAGAEVVLRISRNGRIREITAILGNKGGGE